MLEEQTQMLVLPDMNSADSQPATLAALRLPLIVFSFYDDDDDLLLAWMFQRWLGIFLTSLMRGGGFYKWPL